MPSGPYARERDLAEAFTCGRAAATTAPGMMVALDEEGKTFPTPLESVAGHERRVPARFIADAQAFLRYLLPLTGPVEPYIRAFPSRT